MCGPTARVVHNSDTPLLWGPITDPSRRRRARVRPCAVRTPLFKAPECSKKESYKAGSPHKCDTEPAVFHTLRCNNSCCCARTAHAGGERRSGVPLRIIYPRREHPWGASPRRQTAYSDQQALDRSSHGERERVQEAGELQSVPCARDLPVHPAHDAPHRPFGLLNLTRILYEGRRARFPRRGVVLAVCSEASDRPCSCHCPEEEGRGRKRRT